MLPYEKKREREINVEKGNITNVYENREKKNDEFENIDKAGKSTDFANNIQLFAFFSFPLRFLHASFRPHFTTKLKHDSSTISGPKTYLSGNFSVEE